MTKVVFNKQGAPLMAYGSTFFASTSGSPAKKAATPGNKTKKAKTSDTIIKLDDYSKVGDFTIADWGLNNLFPQEAIETIKKVGVLNTGLKYIRNFTIGQGIFPATVTGYNSDGSEMLEVINDKDLIGFCQGRVVRRYLEKALRDYLKLGVANAHLIPSEDGKTIQGIEIINAPYCRYTVAKDGVIEKCIVSGRWLDGVGDAFEPYDLLDDYDPYADLDRRRMGGTVKGASLVYAIKDSWSNNDYYPEPAWYSSYLAGWVDIAMVVPKFLRKAYENQINWKWHVKIPYAFWDKKFPEQNYSTIELREAAITEYLDSIEKNLCSPENADKAFFTFFEINPSTGKAEEQWIIEPLENKYKEGDKLVTSAAANSEILFALMINPNVLGAGMPGGIYSGNQGGSNIREAFLVNIANAWLDRQNLLDPLEAMLQYNGVKDVQLRFGNTILTTLDTGAGTKKTLS